MHTVVVGTEVISPSKVICIGRNYVEHIAELGNEVPDELVVFLKPNSDISAELLSSHQESLYYEGELCFVYHQGRFNAVGFGLDLTKRALQSKLKGKGLPWERAKAFDGSAVFSDFVAISDVEKSLSLELTINGKTIQSGGIELMMAKPDDILNELQSFMTLEDGDIVMTGTPKGVGLIEKGAIFEGKVVLAGNALVSQSWTAK